MTSAATLVVLLALTGCGSDEESGAEATDTASSTPSEDAGGTPPAGGGMDEAQLEEIRECLDAAGLEDAFPSEMPSDMPEGEMPSDMPSEMPEGETPSDMPSDMPEGEGGGGMAALQDPEVQEALDACGIELPEQGTPPEGSEGSEDSEG